MTPQNSSSDRMKMNRGKWLLYRRDYLLLKSTLSPCLVIYLSTLLLLLSLSSLSDIMGLLATFAGPLANHFKDTSIALLILTAIFAFLSLSLLVNVARQILFKDPTKPPVVFHWLPFIGSTISYGIDPIKFFTSCHEKVSFPIFCAVSYH
jgi:hypothetical protein